MKRKIIIKFSKIINQLAKKETKIEIKLREIAFEKEISVEDKKLIKEYRKDFKTVNKLINRVQNSKIYNDGQKRHFLGKYLFGARGHCINRIKIIKDKYIKEEKTET